MQKRSEPAQGLATFTVLVAVATLPALSCTVYITVYLPACRNSTSYPCALLKEATDDVNFAGGLAIKAPAGARQGLEWRGGWGKVGNGIWGWWGVLQEDTDEVDNCFMFWQTVEARQTVNLIDKQQSVRVLPSMLTTMVLTAATPETVTELMEPSTASYAVAPAST